MSIQVFIIVIVYNIKSLSFMLCLRYVILYINDIRRKIMNYIKESNRIYAENENGKLVAEITFPEISEGVIEINHTFVDTSLRGMGVAGELVKRVCEVAKEYNKTIVPTCSYAVKWFEKNSKYENLIKR